MIHRTDQRIRRRRGFTIVELVVVIVLISVLAGMAMPRMLSSGGNARIRESACRLATAARCAREFAVLQQCPVRMVIDAHDQSFRIVAQPPTDGVRAKYAGMGAGFGRRESLGAGIRFDAPDIEPIADRPTDGKPGEAFITFYPNGQADAAAVRITDGRRTWSLRICPSNGSVELVDRPVRDLPQDRLDLDV